MTSETQSSGRLDRLLLLLVLLAAAGSLFLATRHMSHSVWYDESQTDYIARQETLGGVTRAAMTERAYPPFFFFAVHYSLKLWGDETGLRLPAALFGALAFIGVFLLGRELAGSATGAVAAFLFVLTPGVFRYFVDGNAYTLLMLASAFSALFLYRAVRSDGIGDWLLYALFALLGIGTHSLFGLSLAAQLLGGLFLKASAGRRAPASYRRFLTVMPVVFLAAFLWALTYIRFGADVRPLVFSRVLEFSTLLSTVAMYAGPLSFSSAPQLVLWLSLQLLGATALFTRRRNVFWFVVILASASLAGITVFIKATLSYFPYRHGLVVFPLACVVAAYALKLPASRGEGPSLPRPGLFKGCIFAAIAGYCVAGGAFILGASESAFEYQDWRGAGSYLNKHVAAGDAVIVPDQYALLPLRYHYKGALELSDTHKPAEFCDAVVRRLEKTGAPDKTAWVVLGSLANENPLVASFTQVRRADLEEQRQELVSAFGNRGLSVCETGRFHRVTVFAVRRKPCAGPTQAF